MNRPSVDPAFTFGVSLAISLVLWFPTLARDDARRHRDHRRRDPLLPRARDRVGRGLRRLRDRRDVREQAERTGTAAAAPDPGGARTGPGAPARRCRDRANPRAKSRRPTPPERAASAVRPRDALRGPCGPPFAGGGSAGGARSAVSPPHTPSPGRVSSAYSRHSSRTGHVAQIALASPGLRLGHREEDVGAAVAAGRVVEPVGFGHVRDSRRDEA